MDLVHCDLSIVNGSEDISRVLGEESGQGSSSQIMHGLPSDLKDLDIHHQSIRKHLKRFKQQ